MINTPNNNTSFNNQKIITKKKLHPLRIMTQNIQGLTMLSKQNQVLQTMSINNIDILGLSETKLTNKSSKYIYKNNSEYVSYFDNRNEHTMSSEVGLIFAKD